MNSLDQIRAYRVAGFSVFDVAVALLVAYVLAKRYRWDLLKTIIVVLVLGEVVHYALGISTPVTRLFQ